MFLMHKKLSYFLCHEHLQMINDRRDIMRGIISSFSVLFLLGFSTGTSAQVSQEEEATFEPPEMVVIPAGSFKMGCVSGRSCNNSERPVHEVTIESFALSKYEVTFEEYDLFTDATGRERADDRGFGRGQRPAVNITWDDAVAYTAWLSKQTGKNYRLPSEAEWEYAARAGTVTRYSWGHNLGHSRANCNGCGSQWDNEMSAPVGSFEANAWGLHDMHGNVWEWTQDRYNNRYVGAPNDGSAWEVGDSTARVVRGGAWYLEGYFLRSAARDQHRTFAGSLYVGFRVAQSL